MREQAYRMTIPPGRRNKSAGRSAGAFTLIELLVVIAIISILMSVLVPSLRRAIERTRDVICTANIRSIAFGWQFYLEDNKETFPLWTQNSQWFYGGKHPALVNTVSGAALEYRPLNPYVQRSLKNESEAELFHCPQSRDIRDPWGVKRITGGYDTYEYFGNCYMMNWTLMIGINPKTGWAQKGKPFHLRDVEISHARCVLTADCQWYYTIHDARWDAHFHNDHDEMSVAFLDGHVRFMQLVRGEAFTSNYSFSPYRIDSDDED